MAGRARSRRVSARALVFAALAAIALWLLSSAPAAGQAAPAKQLMSEQAFKNVTVLKGIPVDEFMNTMGFISAATNYNCTDCHVEPKVEGDWSVYAQETPRKATARRMILMVQAINQDEFRGSARRDLLHLPSQSPRRAQDHAEIGGAVRRAARRSIPMKSRLPGKRLGRLPPIRSLTSISRQSEERRKQPPSPASSSRAHTKGMRNPRRLWTFM